MANRTTVNLNVYHEQTGEPIFGVSKSFHFSCESQEQAYQRRITVSETPVALNLGWIVNSPGLLVIENREGTLAKTIPTEQERETLANQSVILQFCSSDQRTHGIEIPAGQSFAVRPSLDAPLSVYCVKGTAAILVTALAR